LGDVVRFRPGKDKKIYVMITVILALVTVLLAYLNLAHSAYDKQINLSGTTIMSIDNSAHIFKKAGEEVIICGSEGVSAVDKNGEISWKVDYGNNNPLLATAGEYVLCAELDGNGCKVWKKGSEISAQKLPNKVITAAVNKNGYYAVASKERGYKSQIAVYSKGGEKIFGWHSTKYHVVAIALSDNNNDMMVSVIDVANEADNAFKLLHFSFKKDAPTEVDANSKNLVSNISFSSGKFYAAGDTTFLAFNEKGNKVFGIDYNGRTLQNYAISETAIVLGLTKTSVEGYYGGSVVEIYSASGTKRGYGEVDDEIIFLDIEGDKILVNSPEGAYILNENGRIYGNIEFGTEVREGIIFYGGKKLLLVDGLNVNVYDSK